ncbi:MAG: cell wall-binding repeat-containing protein [Oscillospiraceae bacterium]|nr:cell wall-binding repeat-containing protein [Oscillospiraceae bacterium]
MKRARTSLFKRITSVFLALVLLLGLLPVSIPHAHAAETVTLTNMAGEETDTFTSGEPIYVETTGYTSSQWLDLWYVKPDGSYESTYRLWWYASDEKMLLWDAVWEGSTLGWDGMDMPAGTYEIYLESATLLKTFTLVEPDATVAAEKSLEVAVNGKKVSIDAINYNEYSQVSVTNASGVEMYQFFCPGRNGLTMETELIPGEYTVSMYNDYYKTDLYVQKTITIEGESVKLLTTDKTEYKFGEPIMVTSQMGDPNWIGLYKQSDANPTSEGPTSLFWVYPPVGEAVNLLSGDQQRHSEFVAGTYKVLLLDANYGIVASVENIVITTEIDETKTVRVEPTCEKDGSETYYNTDGTVAKVETISALGHDYETLRPEFDAENLQHTFVCSNDNTHQYTENCTWDEGIVIEEPTTEADGKKEFTCTVCGGHRYEKVSAKVVEREEITVPAKCETPGTKVIYYTDGTSEEVEIPKLNHAYPASWTYNNDKATHSRVCANDASHVETGSCSFETSAVAGGTRYTCSVCGGYYDVIILSTSKTEYALGEPILVTVNPDVYDETATDWVGIWENNWTYSDNVSIYYYYPAVQGWTDFNIYNSAYHQRDHIAQGEYTIRLFAADDYTEITNVTITVGPAVRDESKTVRVEPTCEKDGSITYYLTDGTVDEVITAQQDPSLKALGHAYPDTWSPVAGTETHQKVCANDATHVLSENCKWDEGVVTKEPTVTEKGELVYTCTVCGSTKSEEVPVLDAVETGREVIAPTCDEQGYTLITYSDGSTRKVDFVDALGHDFGAYTHIDGSYPPAHSQVCQREDCGEIKTEACSLETNGVLDGNSYYFACTKCGEWNENVILTNKEVYAAGEDIIITVHPNYAATMSSTDWIGLYHKGETPSNTGVTSIRWNYAPDFVDGMSIFQSSNHDRPQEDPNNVLKAGQYTLFLCRNDGYEIAARTTITVVTEEDPSKTVLVPPTCTEGGTMTYYNTDGSVSRVVTAAEDASLKAHGHTYGSWTYDGVEKQTHTHVCACTACVEPCGFVETTPCQWNEGVVTKEPSETEEGVKTYTCTVCGGTRDEALPKVNVTVVGTKTVEATCEEPGYIRTYYSDDTYSDEVIPAKGHAYGSWTYVAATKQHKKVCANDAAHEIFENCTFEKVMVDNSVNYTCTVCEGGYVTGLLETDKTVYGVTDPIMVTAHASYPGAWVGLYKEGELFDPNNGGVASLFWTYITTDMVGKPFDITAVTVGTGSGHRGEKLSNGKHVLVFFGDSGYGNVISKVELEVYTDMSNTDFEILFNGEARENGYHESFMLADVDEPANGETVTLGINVKSGEIGNAWMAVYAGKYDLNTEYGTDYLLYRYVTDIDGKEPFSLNLKSAGGFDFSVGYYTVVIFGDGGYDYPIKYMTFEVCRPIVEGSEIILKAPTCETPGLKMVDYEDDGDASTEDEGILIELPALGHNYGEWTCVEGTNTHSKICANDASHVISENCVFENDVCTVCGGNKAHVHDLTKVAAKAATCTEAGSIEYYTCACGKWFKDAAATQEITDKSSVVVPASDHSYGSWVFDAATKKHTRTCANDAAHTETNDCTFGEAVVIQPAVGNIKGVKEYTCTVCGGSYTEEFAAEATGTAERIYGDDRYLTSLKVADQLKENLGVEKFQAIVVASGNEFADALSGTYLAAKKDAPILLVRQKCMDTIKDYIRSNLVAGGTVYILGGTVAVPASMESGLDGFNVKRLGGNDRYETNLLILKEAGVTPGEDILACTGRSFADTLSASATGKAILLVKDRLYSTQKDFLRTVGGGNLYIVGGKSAVSEQLAGELGAYGTVQRIDGTTRYETSVNVAKTFFSETSCAVLAYGNNFPDGLCGGALASSMDAPLLLVTNDKYSAAEQYAKANHVSHGFVLGGPTLITNTVSAKIFNNK